MVSNLHIGAAGELLVQYRLLRLGIDSARMTTDSGVDAVAYTSLGARTIQVKTNHRFTPAGGTGAASVGFTFPAAGRFDLLACVLLEPETVWLFGRHRAIELAQQLSARGEHRLYWYGPDAAVAARRGLPWSALDEHLLENTAYELLGAPAADAAVESGERALGV